MSDATAVWISLSRLLFPITHREVKSGRRGRGEWRGRRTRLEEESGQRLPCCVGLGEWLSAPWRGGQRAGGCFPRTWLVAVAQECPLAKRGGSGSCPHASSSSLSGPPSLPPSCVPASSRSSFGSTAHLSLHQGKSHKDKRRIGHGEDVGWESESSCSAWAGAVVRRPGGWTTASGLCGLGLSILSCSLRRCASWGVPSQNCLCWLKLTFLGCTLDQVNLNLCGQGPGIWIFHNSPSWFKWVLNLIPTRLSPMRSLSYYPALTL